MPNILQTVYWKDPESGIYSTTNNSTAGYFICPEGPNLVPKRNNSKILISVNAVGSSERVSTTTNIRYSFWRVFVDGSLNGTESNYHVIGRVLLLASEAIMLTRYLVDFTSVYNVSSLDPLQFRLGFCTTSSNTGSGVIKTALERDNFLMILQEVDMD